jgi:hypothetical protein
MNDTSNTAAQLDQADEEIFTPTLSDEALEAAGTEGGLLLALPPTQGYTAFCRLGGWC